MGNNMQQHSSSKNWDVFKLGTWFTCLLLLYLYRYRTVYIVIHHHALHWNQRFVLGVQYAQIRIPGFVTIRSPLRLKVPRFCSLVSGFKSRWTTFIAWIFSTPALWSGWCGCILRQFRTPCAQHGSWHTKLWIQGHGFIETYQYYQPLLQWSGGRKCKLVVREHGDAERCSQITPRLRRIPQGKSGENTSTMPSDACSS